MQILNVLLRPICHLLLCLVGLYKCRVNPLELSADLHLFRQLNCILYIVVELALCALRYHFFAMLISLSPLTGGNHIVVYISHSL